MTKASKPKQIKVTDDLGNVAYIHQRGEDWFCTLANGTPASFSYAVGNCDEMNLRARLQSATDDAMRLRVVKYVAGARRTVELV